VTVVTSRTERLRARIDAAGRVKLPLGALLRSWSEAAPELRGRADQFELLVASLDDLAAIGHLTLPAAASWDRSTTPALPFFVTVPGARRARRPGTWRSHPWCPELAWVASLTTLTERLVTDLLAVDDWLGGGGPEGDEPLPLRMRSSEIFGDEKRLDDLTKSALFGPGRLSLELLGARRYPPPLAMRRVGDGPEVFVVENSDPFWAASTILERIAGPIGRVAFGSGASVESSIAALAWEDRHPAAIWYWGDLDPEGLRIASGAAATALGAGLVRLRPADPLWSAMVGCPVATAGEVDWGPVDESWLGPTTWEATAPVRAVHGCVRQEAVPVAALEAALVALSAAVR